jgi:hypothetical protein
MDKHYRQGDVLLVKVGSLPKDAKPEAPDEKNIVLAYGETTGHSHRIAAAYAKAYQWKGDRLIEIKQQAQLVHEEHNAISLEPGIYKVVLQREYTPTAIRQVLD